MKEITMKWRILAPMLLCLCLASRSWAGAIPNGGHVYLQCENFNVGGPGNVFGTAGKTTDAHGNCILTFTQSTTQWATAKFFFPHSALENSWGFSPILTTPTGLPVVANTGWTGRIECSTTNSHIALNNASNVSDSGVDLLTSATTPGGVIGGRDANYAVLQPWDEQAATSCGFGVCQDYSCVFRLTRVNVGSDDATASVFGVDLAFPTP